MVNFESPQHLSKFMSLAPPIEGLPKSVQAFLSLFDEFDDLADRYLEAQTEKFHSTPEEKLVDLAEEIWRRKSQLEMLRFSSQLPHRLLETCRCRDWYKKDRETLSRHTVLLALLPETFDNEQVPGAAGELTSRLLEERKVLSLHYPHLYDPKALGTPPALDSEDYCSLLEEVHNLELEQAGLSDERWEESEMKRGAIESLFMPIQDVDPLYAEEALAVWNEVRHAYEIIVGENGMNVREEAAEMIRLNDPIIQLLLNRFVLESLMFRVMLEDETDVIDERIEQWFNENRSRSDILRPVSREEADRSMDIMNQLFAEPLTSYTMMMDAAQSMADLEDDNSSWNMVQATLSRCIETDFWPEMAMRGVLTQLSFDGGRQEELSRAILAKGEEGGDARTVAMGLAAMTIALHSLGRSDESARYHERMMRELIARSDDPDVLVVYPFAAGISMEMGDKKSVRRLAGIGLRAMEQFPEFDGQRDQLLELRRSVDRVDKKRGVNAAHKPGKGARNRRCGQ